MKKLDNRGFSLVELLIAVLVLAIITVPMLQMYVMSARTAAKSRQVGDATTAAQNIVEAIQATDVSQVLSADASDVAALFGPGVTAGVAPDAADGGGTLTLQDVSAGSGTFDAQVELDPSDYRDAGRVNDKEITQYTAMDGVYYQKTGDMDVDTLAEDEFNQSHSDAVLTTRSRAIGITIDSGGTAVQFTYTFGYSWTDTSGEEPVERHATAVIAMPESELFPDGYPTVGEPFSVYMFFNPYYDSNDALYQDSVTINNKENLDCSVFLVKQNTADAMVAKENAYGAKVVLRENHSASTEFCTTVFSNIGEKLLSAGKIAKLSYRKYYSAVYYMQGDLGSGELIDRQKEDRLYDVRVKIYPPDSDDLVYALEATKLQ